MELANFSHLKDLDIPQRQGESGLFAYFAEQLDSGVTWADLEWLRSLVPIPLAVKGILRPDDAVRAVEAGAEAIIVSNHGGRQLDGAIAAIDALSEIVAAIGNRAEVLMDGGIRRGTDILKALALGAKAILVGRPVLWGLAVAGETGVQHVIEILRDELSLAMALSGCAKLQDIDRSLVAR
jgi:4-hydroxymandelate oxidase